MKRLWHKAGKLLNSIPRTFITLARAVVFAGGAAVCLLGLHGMYVYFSAGEVVFGGKDPARLFLGLGMPAALEDSVKWATLKGLQSWFLPLVIAAGGAVLAWLAARWRTRRYYGRTAKALSLAVLAGAVICLLWWAPWSHSGAVAVPPHAQTAHMGHWEFTLNGVKWRGSELTVSLTIRNAGAQPDTFQYPNFFGTQGKIVAVDSYGRATDSDLWSAFYFGEYYPRQSRTGTLTFEMNPYAGQTQICVGGLPGMRKTWPLFHVGAPPGP